MVKKGLLEVARLSGGFVPFRLLNRNKALVLTYHRFSQQGNSATTSAREFAEQLHYLSSRYRFVSLSQLARVLRGEEDLPLSAVTITIDDGYNDAYQIALPILKHFNVPATIFVVTDFVDRHSWIWTDKLRFLLLRWENPDTEIRIGEQAFRIVPADIPSKLRMADSLNTALKAMTPAERDSAINEVEKKSSLRIPELPPENFASVTWAQISEMEASGIEIGSHTVSHPVLTGCTLDQLKHELNQSRGRLERRLGHAIELFCYPNGNHDERVRSEVANAGYKCAVTTELGFNDHRSDVLALKRIHTEHDLGHFVQATSGLEILKAKFRSAQM